MTADELYQEGQNYLIHALENTQYTHIHSVDIRNDVYKNYTLPAAEQGSVFAIRDVAIKFIDDKEYIKATIWIKKYKEITHCSKMKLIITFGSSVIKRLFKMEVI